jgi:hypothetical protein
LARFSPGPLVLAAVIWLCRYLILWFPCDRVDSIAQGGHHFSLNQALQTRNSNLEAPTDIQFDGFIEKLSVVVSFANGPGASGEIVRIAGGLADAQRA